MLKSLRKMLPLDHPAVARARRIAAPAGHFLAPVGRFVAPVFAAIQRSMSRDVMLFAGGASYFSMLALFPAIALAMSIYGLIFSMDDARAQFARFAEIVPGGAQNFVLDQMERLTNTPIVALSFNGAIALAIALFAAARGMKALIAGLNHLAAGQDVRNVLHFNLLAMAGVLVGGALLVIANTAVLVIPVFFRRLSGYLGVDAPNTRLLINEWSAASAVFFVALLLLYRMTMRRRSQRESISWRSALIAAGTVTVLWMLLSKGFSTYVGYVIDASVYGSLGALVVLLLWIYWSAYAVFFGGALAIEIDRRRRWAEDDEAKKAAEDAAQDESETGDGSEETDDPPDRLASG